MSRTLKIIVTLLAGLFLFSMLAGCMSVKEPEKPKSSDLVSVSDKPNLSVTPSPTEVPPSPTVIPTSENDALEKAANAYLDKLGCPLASADDNRLGLSITSIEKAGEQYKISWSLSNAQASGSNNDAYLFSLMRFFDPDDFSNNYQAFTTTSDGKIQYTFGAGDKLTYKTFRINFQPDSKIAYLFFAGVLESSGAPSELYTQPMFFTLILGDEPKVLESTPRLADGIFDSYIKKS